MFSVWKLLKIRDGDNVVSVQLSFHVHSAAFACWAVVNAMNPVSVNGTALWHGSPPTCWVVPATVATVAGRLPPNTAATTGTEASHSLVPLYSSKNSALV